MASSFNLFCRGQASKNPKLQPINGFSLLLILNLDIPHGGVKTFVTGEVFNGERPHSLLGHDKANPDLPEDFELEHTTLWLSGISAVEGLP